MSLNPKDIACSSIFPVPDSLPVQLGFLDNDFLSGICVCFFLFPPGLHYDEGVDFINPDTGYSDPYSTLSDLECNRQVAPADGQGEHFQKKPRRTTSKSEMSEFHTDSSRESKDDLAYQKDTFACPSTKHPLDGQPVPIPRRKTLENSHDVTEPSKTSNFDNANTKLPEREVTFSGKTATFADKHADRKSFDYPRRKPFPTPRRKTMEKSLFGADCADKTGQH